MLMSVVLPSPDSPTSYYFKNDSKDVWYVKLTDNHDSEVRAPLSNNFVPLQIASSISTRFQFLNAEKHTWLGRLAMPIPSAEMLAVAMRIEVD